MHVKDSLSDRIYLKKVNYLSLKMGFTKMPFLKGKRRKVGGRILLNINININIVYFG